MDISQAVSFVLIMILALYGFAKLVDRIGDKWLRPRCQRLVLLLPLDGENDTEMQLRAAQHMSKQLALPLLVSDEGMDTQSRMVAETMLRNGIGEWIDLVIENE